jgi:hypothetical protein
MTAHSVAVYDGRTRIGNVIRRHWTGELAVGFEAIAADEQSLGVFADEQSAIAAIWKHARGQQP